MTINGIECHWTSLTGTFQNNFDRGKPVGLGLCNKSGRDFEKSSNLGFPVLLWGKRTCSVTEMTTWKHKHHREV